MEAKEQENVEDTRFTSWYLVLGKLVGMSDGFDITEINKENCQIKAEINKREVTFTYEPGKNYLTLTLEHGGRLTDLALAGWIHTEGKGIFSAQSFEGLQSPRIDTGADYTKIIFVKNPGKPMRVLQTVTQKSSPGI